MTLRNETLNLLCQLLRTGDEADRCYVARALGNLRDTAPVELLIERLKDEDIDVAIDAAEALGKIGSSEAVPALIESLENDPSGELCTVIAEALGKIGSSKSVDALLKILLERPEALEWDDDWDTWWDVQMESVKALGAARAEIAIEPLLNIIDDEEQQDIENEILHALIKISFKGEAQVIDRLQNLESSPQKRRRAARALAKSGTSAATKALGRALMDKAPEVRAAAALSLAAQHTEKYLHALVLMLRDPSEEVREAVIKAVIRLAKDGANSEDLQASLYPMLRDPSSRVRATLFNTLLPVVSNNPLSNENFNEVVENIGDGAAETAGAACTLLGANGNPEAVTPLLELLKNTTAHPMARREAAFSVGKLGQIDTDVIETLRRMVGDKQQHVRLAALAALMALETSGAEVLEDAENPPQRPLEIVIDAVNGNIALLDEPAPDTAETAITEAEAETDEEIDVASTDRIDGQAVAFDPDAMKKLAESNNIPEIPEEPVPERIAETITLPENPARIVQEGEVQPAMSTLDAIAMENVELMLDTSATDEAPAHDAVTQEYLGIVEDNKALVRRMRSNRRINAEQDVRRLGARILAESEEESAIDALNKALSDEDTVVRREAAEAIGAIARRNRQLPKLMDTVGTLITQLAVDGIEQKITCASTLGALGNRAALAPLMEATKAPEFTLRVQAIEALARLSVDGMQADEAGHMVVRDVPPLSVARRLMECLDDGDMGVRVAAAKGLAQVLKPLHEETFTQKAVEKIVSSVTMGTGEEARLIGKALRQFDTTLGNRTLLAQLKEADDSVKRSVFIEMIEELLDPQQGQPEQAA
ncbi:MAG: HEAT repeat domain-containing protein [Pseudomonadota bacterium]